MGEGEVKIGFPAFGPPDDRATLMAKPLTAVVPQLGGLVVSEQLEITGTGGDDAVAQQMEAIVNHPTSLPACA